MKRFVALFLVVCISLYLATIAYAWNAQEAMEEAQRLEDSGRYGDAIEKYRVILAKEPENFSILIKLANLLKFQREYEEAIVFFSRALAASPSQYKDDINVEIAALLSRNNKYEKAISILTAVLSKNQKHRGARIELAKTYAWSGHIKEAVEEYNILIGERPDDTEAQIGFATAISWQGKYDEAVSAYMQVLEKYPNNFDARLGLVNVLRWKGETEKSQEELNVLLSLYPENKDALKIERQLRNEKGPVFSVYRTDNVDSDSNHLVVYKNQASYGYAPWLKLFMDYSIFDASRYNLKSNANILTIRSTYTASKGINISPRLSLVNTAADANDTSMLTGGLGINWDFFKPWTASISYNIIPLLDTAQLITNDIRAEEYGANLHYGGKRITISAGATYAIYSDNNLRKDFSLEVAYILFADQPVVKTGYILNYRDFLKDTNSGYFAPNDYLANRLYISLSDNFYRDRINYVVEGDVGTQSYNSDFNYTASFHAKLVWLLTRAFSADISYKWSRSSLESQTGYSFEMYKIGLNYAF